MSGKRYCVIDFETRSECDIKKSGAWEYSVHPSTQVMCVAWRLGAKEELAQTPVQVWSPAIPSPHGEFLRALRDPDVVLVAHNAFFERSITRNVLSRIIHDPTLRNLPASRWLCTASMCRAMAIPGNLEMASHALGLSHQKDMVGHRLMLKLSKPRRATKDNTAKWHSKKSDLLRLMEYCKTDVLAQTEILLRLPELSPKEREIWLLDQKINDRGFLTDQKLVSAVLGMIAEETQNLNRETEALTSGVIKTTNRRQAVLDYLADDGVMLPDLTAKTVADALSSWEWNETNARAKRLLEIRQAISKTSTAKYEAFRLRGASDGRVRDHLVYSGAMPTSRWSGAGVQPQNFPRGTIKDTALASTIIKEDDLEMVRLLYGNPMDVFASCLRAVIIASEGKMLHCADFAAIEVRVLFWMARHTEGLKAFIEGRDLYKEMATYIYNKSVDAILFDERQLGKKAVLGCGYQMGHKKFFATCKQDGMEVSESVSEVAVAAYRKVHAPVVRMWRNVERAAMAAVKNPGTGYRVNRTRWIMEGDFLFCELPSGRRQAYYKAEIKYELNKWGEKSPKLYAYGLNPRTKKWELESYYGGKLVENCVQGCAREFMVGSMLRIDAAGYDIALTVHDEGLAEGDAKRKNAQPDFEDLMAKLPAWGDGCPIRVEGWTATRYRK